MSKEKNDAKGVNNDIAKFAIGGVAGMAAYALGTQNCGVLTICGILSILVVLFVIANKLNGKKFSIIGKVIISAIILILCGVGVWHKLNCHNVVIDEPVAISAPAEEEPAEGDEADTNDNEDGGNGAVITNGVGYCPPEEIILPTFANQEVAEVINITKDENEELPVIVDNSVEEAIADQLIEEAIENGDNVIALEDGIVAITKNDDNDTDETNKGEKVDLPFEEAVEFDTEGNDLTSTPVADSDEEETIEKTEPTSEDLLDLLEKTEPEEDVTTTKQNFEENAESNLEVLDIVMDNDNTDEMTDLVIDEAPAMELSVVAIDGYTATVGSSVQFKISGENITIDGLDGIDYTFSNGILTIEVGDEATVLSVSVSDGIDCVDFDITVNGIF